MADNSANTKPKCRICNRTNHPTNKCHLKGVLKCGKCGKFGHKTNDCWGDKPPGKKGGKGKEKEKEKEKEHANAAQEDEDAEMSYVASPDVSHMNEDSISFYLWYADSGTTSHLTHLQSAFTDYKLIDPKPIRGLGYSQILAYGKGTVEATRHKKGKTQTLYLKETLFTPDHPDNLLSIGRIDDSGGTVVFGNHKVVLYDRKNNDVASGDQSNN